MFTWNDLISVYSLGNSNDLHWKTFHKMFCNASNLEALPNEKLILDNVPLSTIVYDISYMFFNCQALTNIPQNFEIHKNTIDLSYMFYYSFRTSDKPIKNSYYDIFPYNGLLAKSINISHCFENCITLNRFIN
jgi:hypothetical protein